MDRYVEINNRKIGSNYPPYIVAELSANHNGDIKRAFKIMEECKNAGADAVKIQTYKPDTITINCDNDDFKIKSGLWKGKNLFELYEEAHLPWEWHQDLFNKAKELDITIFSSPFDFTSVELLENFNVPAYKIASFELIDLPLIKRVAQTKKPMIMSTGMANFDEIKEALETAKKYGSGEIIILHCVSGYPAPAKDYNIKTIKDISKKFDVLSGLSDHTIDNATSIASIAMGACLIEKHVTLDRNGGGPDDSFSLEPKELFDLCSSTKIAWKSLGKVNYKKKKSELPNIKFRRSLYVVSDINEGEKITEKNIKSIRPGYGLLPKHFESCLGMVAKKNIKMGTPLSFDLIKK